MIIITGAAGFIGSCLVSKLNQEDFNDLILVDDFEKAEREGKMPNLEDKTYTALVDRKDLIQWLDENERFVQFIFHIGARTDTTEFDTEIFDELNLNYTKALWNKCIEHALPMVYASSAATYGLGEHGYVDSHEIVEKLKPLNPYGDSKNDFDKWALKQEKKPFYWAGLKFFNVYGPNEYHKGRMASVVFHAFNQIKENGKVKLFRSHREDYEDGMQLRDFIYVKDVVEVMYWLMHHRKDSGLYNLGTGRAESFRELAESTFAALDKDPVIEFIDTPKDIRDTYQYYTEADMSKLRSIGYDHPFMKLREGVEDYVQNYLTKEKYH
ncbi:MAG: ADP-glyceromanno-heptose 6-epimerase [Flavobacteriales bacterium]|nr:ADP-glyceromanno-heptose 6-epimerase [Flavobacteriales bacterium]